MRIIGASRVGGEGSRQKPRINTSKPIEGRRQTCRGRRPFLSLAAPAEDGVGFISSRFLLGIFSANFSGRGGPLQGAAFRPCLRHAKKAGRRATEDEAITRIAMIDNQNRLARGAPCRPVYGGT